MIGRNLLIVGQPGAGKTLLARRLFRTAPRAVVVDPWAEYPDDLTGSVRAEGTGAYGVLADRYDDPFLHLAWMPEREPMAEVEGLLQVVELVQRSSVRAEPLAVIIDESTMISETHVIGPQLRRLYNMGRRWNVCLVTIAQVDTDVHRLSRRNAQLVVVMNGQTLSSDLQKMVDMHDFHALAPLDHPTIRPENRTHYVTSPQGVDVLNWWTAVVGGSPLAGTGATDA